jgi:hypothetical protein
MKYLLYAPKGRCGSVSLSIMALHTLYLKKSNPDTYTHNYHAGFVDKSDGVQVIEHVNDEEICRIPLLEREPVNIVGMRETYDKTKSDALVLEHAPYIFTKEQQDSIPDNTVMHSHGCFSASEDDWKNILVSRKNKLELTMSQLIAMKSGVWQNLEGEKIQKFPKDLEYLNASNTDEPFVFPKYSYLESLKQLEAAESAFIKNVRKTTGKDPIIIYLEDTLEEKSRKIGLDLVITKHVPGISVRRPKDYILNYDELKEVYDDFIENKEYHMSIPFKN